MIEPPDVAVHLRLLALEHVLVVGDRRDQNVRLAKYRHPLGRRPRREDLVEDLLDLVAAKVPRRIIAFRIVHEIGPADDLAEPRPARVVDAGETDPIVLRAESSPHTMKELMSAARALRLATGDRRLEDLPRLKREPRAVNRCVDARAAP